MAYRYTTSTCSTFRTSRSLHVASIGTSIRTFTYIGAGKVAVWFCCEQCGAQQCERKMYLATHGTWFGERVTNQVKTLY